MSLGEVVFWGSHELVYVSQKTRKSLKGKFYVFFSAFMPPEYAQSPQYNL